MHGKPLENHENCPSMVTSSAFYDGNSYSTRSGRGMSVRYCSHWEELFARQAADANASRSPHGLRRLGRHRALGRCCPLGEEGAQTTSSEKVQVITPLVCKR